MLWLTLSYSQCLVNQGSWNRNPSLLQALNPGPVCVLLLLLSGTLQLKSANKGFCDPGKLFKYHQFCTLLYLTLFANHRLRFHSIPLKIFELTHLSLASLLWDIGKQNSPRSDAAERGAPSGAILFA